MIKLKNWIKEWGLITLYFILLALGVKMDNIWIILSSTIPPIIVIVIAFKRHNYDKHSNLPD